MIYMDNAATTKVAPKVFDQMTPYLKELYFNPSSLYKESRTIKNDIEKSRNMVADLINADADELIFTSCGTEANNMAIKGSALQLRDKGRHLITSEVEHHSVLNTFKWLETQGYEVTYLPVDQSGRVQLESLSKAIRNDTILISLMWVNNETGVIADIEGLSRIAKESGIVFHTDAVQALKTETIDMSLLDIDLLTISAHKIHGPKGVAALYCRNRALLSPLIHGGKQEAGIRGGTESVANIIGFGEAARLLKEDKLEIRQQLRCLKDLFIDKLDGCKGFVINGNKALTVPSIVNVGFQGVQSEPIVIVLNHKGICISMGAACNSEYVEPSYVLRAMKVPSDYIEGCLRISFSGYNTEEEVNVVVETLLKTIDRMRAYE